MGYVQNTRPASPIGRYLLYAFGEIALVVIGILLALQVNNWNEARKWKETEQIYLHRIHEDLLSLLSNSQRFENAEAFLSMTEQALRCLETCTLNEESKAAFESTLSLHQMLGLFPVKRTAYDEMLAAGIMAKLSSDSLKSLISELYANIEAAQDRLHYFRDELGRASAIIMNNVQFSFVDGEFTVLDYDFPALCKNLAFRNALVEVNDARVDTNSMAQEIIAQVKRAIAALEMELSVSSVKEENKRD